MKCSKCCIKIPENEEIAKDKTFYCEICGKSDKWKRNCKSIALGVFIFVFFLIMICFCGGLVKEVRKKDCERKHADDD